MLAGAVGTGLLLREQRKRENEKLGQEAFIRESTHKAVMEGIQNGTLNPDDPGIQGMLTQVYKDKGVVQGIQALAKETFQPGSAARQGLFSPYKTLPEGVGPTIYMPDQLSPQEINQEYQNRINKNPALLAVANPKAYGAMAQQTQAGITSQANTAATVAGANQRAVFNQGQQNARQEDQQAFTAGQTEITESGKTNRQLRGFAHDQAMQEGKQEFTETANTQRNTLGIVTAMKDRLPADISIAELADAVNNGNIPPQLQRKLGPSLNEVKALTAQRAAAQKYIADIGIQKSFADLRKTFNESARSKVKLSAVEKQSHIDAARAGMIDRAMAGIDSVPDPFLMSSVRDAADNLPVFYDGELLSLAQLKGLAGSGDTAAGMLADQIEGQLTQAVQARIGNGQRQAPPGTPEAQYVPGAPGGPGGPPAAGVSAYGETPEQIAQRWRTGAPPPAPAVQGKQPVPAGFDVTGGAAPAAAPTPKPTPKKWRSGPEPQPTPTEQSGPPEPTMPPGYSYRLGHNQVTDEERALVKRLEEIRASKNYVQPPRKVGRGRQY